MDEIIFFVPDTNYERLCLIDKQLLLWWDQLHRRNALLRSQRSTMNLVSVWKERVTLMLQVRRWKLQANERVVAIQAAIRDHKKEIARNQSQRFTARHADGQLVDDTRDGDAGGGDSHAKRELHREDLQELRKTEVKLVLQMSLARALLSMFRERCANGLPQVEGCYHV